jgi:hypothetical protein
MHARYPIRVGCLAHEGEMNDVVARRLDAFSSLLGIIPHRKKEIARPIVSCKSAN